VDGFQCVVSFSEDRADVVVCGEVDLSTASIVEREVMATLALPVREMTLNLGLVTFLDSSGIGALLKAQIAAVELGIGFALTSVPARVRRVLELTGVAQKLGLDPGAGGTAPVEGDAAG